MIGTCNACHYAANRYEIQPRLGCDEILKVTANRRVQIFSVFALFENLLPNIFAFCKCMPVMSSFSIDIFLARAYQYRTLSDVSGLSNRSLAPRGVEGPVHSERAFAGRYPARSKRKEEKIQWQIQRFPRR
jgi:hypothetical protein